MSYRYTLVPVRDGPNGPRSPRSVVLPERKTFDTEGPELLEGTEGGRYL